MGRIREIEIEHAACTSTHRTTQSKRGLNERKILYIFCAIEPILKQQKYLTMYRMWKRPRGKRLLQIKLEKKRKKSPISTWNVQIKTDNHFEWNIEWNKVFAHERQTRLEIERQRVRKTRLQSFMLHHNCVSIVKNRMRIMFCHEMSI